MSDSASTANAMTLAELARLGAPLRVRVAALILDNFKSFAKKTRIPLQDGFTTISGPNGSGKSNIIDALQFVLATSTSKGMRAERLSDLISTMNTKPTCKVCLEIECVFGNSDGPPVKRVFTLGRSVRRRKSGADVRYLLDGNSIRLSDLQEVMRHLGFPTSGQNFVLQNDVIRLTSMGPVARRQVLDELAGTRDFDKRIGLAEAELESSDELTHDTRLILSELSQRLEQLRKERDQALRFQTLTESKQGLEEDLIVLDVTEAEQRVASKQATIEETEKKRRSHERRQEQLEREERKAKTVLDDLEEELSEKGEGERMQAFRAVESLRARLEADHAKAEETRLEVEATERRRPLLAKAVVDAEGAEKAAKGVVEDIEAAIGEKQARLSVLAQKFEAAGAVLRQHGKDRFDVADRLRVLRQDGESLRVEESTFSTRDHEIAEQFGRKEAERALLAGTVGGATGRKTELTAEHVAATALYRENREAFAKVDARRGRLTQQIHDLRGGMETVYSKLSRARQDLAGAKACREQAHAMGGGRALAEIRKAQVKGVHGTVSSLVEFEGRYATALETAAGGRLNYVVVDDEHVASRSIALLKRSGAGRLSFAPISKLRAPANPGAAPRGRGIVGWAVDLVSSDRAYDAVMRVVFGQTLVVESLEDAKPLIGRHRMVTLDGDLVERNAIMSGGSRGRRGGLLAAAAAAGEQIKVRSKAVAELEKQQRAAQDAVRKAEAELSALAQEVTDRRAALAESETNSANLARQLSEIESTFGPQADRMLELEEQLATLCHEREAIAPKLQAARERLAVVEREVQALDDPEASRAYEELTSKTSEVESELRPLEAQVNQLRLEFADAMAKASSAEARLEAARDVLAKADEEIATLGEKLARIQAEIEELIAEQGEKQKVLEALSSELTELANKRNAAREAAQVARDAAREAAAAVAVHTEKLEAFATEFEALSERAAQLRAAAEERGVEVLGPDEAPPDLPKERRRISGRLGQIEAELKKLGGVNHLAIEQYDSSVERHDELEAKIEVLEQEKEQLRERIVTLQGKKRAAFLEAFEQVRVAFAETFRELARGEGRLILENPKDPFAGGLLVKVRPRGKKLSRMEIMSGGEKALTALALIFALQEVNPAALFIFDEVDKDLDGVNTMILAEAVRRRAMERQYVVISHHRVLLERSHHTLGVTMRRGHGTQVTGVTMSPDSDDVPAEAQAEAETAGVAS